MPRHAETLPRHLAYVLRAYSGRGGLCFAMAAPGVWGYHLGGIDQHRAAHCHTSRAAGY